MLGDPRNLVRLYDTKADPGMFHRRFNNIWSVTSRARQRRFLERIAKALRKSLRGGGGRGSCR